MTGDRSTIHPWEPVRITKMKAIYLPYRASPDFPPFAYETNPGRPSALLHRDDYPEPAFPHDFEQDTEASKVNQYLLRVITASPTRDELTWDETLYPRRFNGANNTGPIPCHDVVGEIIKVHTSPGADGPIPKFEIGDIVFGMIDADRDCAAAERVVVLESEIARIPSCPDGKMTKEQWQEMLASIPLSSMTAWQALFEYGGLQPPKSDSSSSQSPSSKKVLITGSSGAVGLITVQLARIASSPSQQVHVTAVSSSTHKDLITSLGADHVICRDQGSDSVESELRNQSPWDLILDFAGAPLLTSILKINASQDLLESSGRIVSISTPLTDEVIKSGGLNKQETDEVKARFKFFIVKPDGQQLAQVAEMMEAVKVRGFVHDDVFPLERAREAMEGCERRGRGLGKVIIRVSS